jgi:hypothetical protein
MFSFVTNEQANEFVGYQYTVEITGAHSPPIFLREL